MTYYKDKWNRTESSEMNLFNVDNWFDKDIKTNSVKGNKIIKTKEGSRGK